MPRNPKKICLIAATPLTFHLFMKDHLKLLSEWADVTIIYNKNYHKEVQPVGINGVIKHVGIVREISIFRDVIAVGLLFLYLKKHDFGAVITLVPKAGLLGLIAARLCGVPTRIHIFQGEVWSSKTGLYRLLLRLADKFTASLSTKLIAVSPSEKKFLICEKICNQEKVNVLGHGSISGVDASRFKPCPITRKSIRASYGIAEEACLLLFLGRLSREKGLFELFKSFNDLVSKNENLVLMVVGPDDEGISHTLLKLIDVERQKLVHFVGFTECPEKFLASADIFCFPSYREGFGMAALEASACAIPVVGSDIHGICDAVLNNQTGILVPPGDPKALSVALWRLTNDSQLRQRYGNAGRERAISLFQSDKIIKLYSNFFKSEIC